MNSHGIRKIKQDILQDIKLSCKSNREKICIEVINRKHIENFCKNNHDIVALKKMMAHELIKEPCEKIIAICQGNNSKQSPRKIKKLLRATGFKTDSFFSSNHQENISGVMNINGFVIPGWSKLVALVRIFSSKAAIFFGKQYAPGRSRLHIRTFEGIRKWYIIAHIDEYNWLHPNLFAAKKHHLVSGKGNYKLGHKLMIRVLRFYFKRKHKIFYYQ